MKTKRPKDIVEYKKWLKDSHQVEISTRTETYYNAVTSKAAADFRVSNFWQLLLSDLTQINQEYYFSTNYYLFVDNSPPELQTKPFESFLLKTFRQNVISNSNWPEPPDSGWLLPANWFSRINDTVRTIFVVKYLDGVNFLAEKCAERATSTSYDSRVDFEAKEEGYYAAHFYVTFPCKVPREDWDTKDETISVEIQITTQLQEVIRRLLHKYYDQRRAERPTSNVKWQWDYRSDEFAANYLGHILHYVEGMIIDVRDKRIGKETKDEG
jgi:hypothetical protein